MALSRQKFDRMDADKNGILGTFLRIILSFSIFCLLHLWFFHFENLNFVDASELHIQRVAHGSGPAITPTVSITYFSAKKHAKRIFL